MDGCPICLCEFDTNYAIIPDLYCNCIYIVHEDCWKQWNDTCIYCRSHTIIHTIDDLSEVQSRINRCKNRIRLSIAIVFYMMLFTYIKFLKAYGFNQILP